MAVRNVLRFLYLLLGIPLILAGAAYGILQQTLLDSTLNRVGDLTEGWVMIVCIVACFSRLYYLENKGCKLLWSTLTLCVVCGVGVGLNVQHMTATLPYVEPTAPQYLMRGLVMFCLGSVGWLVFMWPALRIWYVDEEPERELRPKKSSTVRANKQTAERGRLHANAPLDDGNAHLFPAAGNSSVISLDSKRRELIR